MEQKCLDKQKDMLQSLETTEADFLLPLPETLKEMRKDDFAWRWTETVI